MSGDLTPRQRQVVDLLREQSDPWMEQLSIAGAVGSTERGIGNVLNRLIDKRLVTCRARYPFGNDWALRERVRPDAAAFEETEQT